MKTNKKLLDHKRVVFLIGAVIAFVTWVVIAGFINPGDSNDISGIPIDYERDAQDYKGKNLQMVGQPPRSIAQVRVEGDGAVIGPLGRTSVTVYADYGVVNGAGTYDVPLYADAIAPGSYSIAALSVQGGGHSLQNSPQDYVTLTFEAVESREFAVEVKADGISAAEGYFAEAPVANPAAVLITGPKTQIDQIARVQAVVPNEDVLDEQGNYPAVPLTLLDAAGAVLDSEGLAYSSEAVDVAIPMMEIRTLPLTVEFTGMPRTFDDEWFMGLVHLSADELQVVGSADAFENISSLSVATFDISELSLGWESDPVNIVLPEGLENHDQLRQITVSLDTSGMAEKTFEVPIDSSNVRNGPLNATISPVAASISVRLLGPEEQIDALLPENISVQIDAFSIQASSGGQQRIPVRVRVPSASRTIAMGGYSVVCDVTIE